MSGRASSTQAHANGGSTKSSSELQRRLTRALEGAPELAPGIERSMVRAFWSRTPLAAHADARALNLGDEK